MSGDKLKAKMLKSAFNYLASNAISSAGGSADDFFDEGGTSGGGSGATDHIVGSTVDVGGTQVHGKQPRLKKL